MRTLLAVLLFSSASSGAFAKCTTPSVAVTGTVTNGAGEAVPGAVVAVSWILGDQPRGPLQSHTDQQGAFRLEFQFPTFTKSTLLRGDVCRESINLVSVSAYSPGYRSKPVLAPVTNWSAEAVLVLSPLSE